jgi:hypothetical protein
VVAKAVVVLTLGSRRDKPLFVVDCLAIAFEWVGKVDRAVSFWSVSGSIDFAS